MREAIRTPRLTSGPEFLCSPRTGYGFFCTSRLGKFIEIPEAESYWVEATTEQWPDGSGSRVEVWFDDGDYWCRSQGQRGRDILMGTLGRYLKKLGVKRDGQPKTVYFRLLYG